MKKIDSIVSFFIFCYFGLYFVNEKFTQQSGEAALAKGTADAVAYGKLFIANPDLPERLRQGLPLNEPDASRFFGGDAAGYTDYPFAAAGSDT